MSKPVWEGGDGCRREGSNKWEIIERLGRRKSLSATLECSIFAFISILIFMPLCSLLPILSKFSLISKQYSCLWPCLTPYPPTTNCNGYLLSCHRLSNSFPEPIAGIRLSSLHKKSLQCARHLLQIPPIPTTNWVSLLGPHRHPHISTSGVFILATHWRGMEGARLPVKKKPQLPEGSHVWCPMPELSRHKSKTIGLECTWSLNPLHKRVTQEPTAAYTHPACMSDAVPTHTGARSKGKTTEK